MAKFKNIYTETCFLDYKGININFSGVTEINDEDLIAKLRLAPDFVEIKEVKETEKSSKKKEVND